MSRAFVKEDGGDFEPRSTFGLPPVEDPSYDAACALVLLEAARDGQLEDAEHDTGYRWGDRLLDDHVRALMEKELERPVNERDRRFLTMARRWLRQGR